MAKSVREKRLEGYVKDAISIFIYVPRIGEYLRISKGEARRIIKLERNGTVNPPFAVSRRFEGKELYLS